MPWRRIKHGLGRTPKRVFKIKGINFHIIFSLVDKIVYICVVLELVALLYLKLKQLDVKINFLQGDLDEEIYME
jgi:hypothetical protein